MKEKKDNKIIILGLIVVAVLAVIAFGTIDRGSNINYDEMNENEIEVAMQENIDTMKKNELLPLGERDRMEYYVSEFIKAIENKKYEEAYDLLYDDFKTNYFPTLDSFEEYAKTKFPKMCSLEYTNFERNGNIYILWVTLSSSLGSKGSGKEMNFVIQENALNDFVMSFSVI